MIAALSFLPSLPAQASGDPAGPARLHFTEKDLPSLARDPAGLSEIDLFSRARGFHYARDTRRAARGEAKALRKFFEIAHTADGAAAESIAGVPTVAYHLLGDEKFAQFLAAEPLPCQMIVRNRILSDGLPAPASAYLSRYFPLTTKLLLSREMVDWPSPNGLLCDSENLQHRVGAGGIESGARRADRESERARPLRSDAGRHRHGRAAGGRSALVRRFETRRLPFDRSAGAAGPLVQQPASTRATQTSRRLSTRRRFLCPRRAVVRQSPRSGERPGTEGRRARPSLHGTGPLGETERAHPAAARILRCEETDDDRRGDFRHDRQPGAALSNHRPRSSWTAVRP